ncbi:MAG: amino acid permease [Candidatus Lokiarchaeota archaeon]|nr:amino acid permease [Candidatus Lokiarchaeota archaeon]
MVEDKELKRGLNLPMAIFIIVGMVIGASIWVNPAAYLSRTGPAMFLAYLIAVIPAIFVAYISAYLGSAFPVAGGSYVISSRILGGFGGFMAVWLIILAVGSTLAYLATTFGVFLADAFLIPAEMEMIFVIVIGLLVLVAFYFLNWIKIEFSGLVELIITLLGDILVMVIFIVAAIPVFNPSNFTNFFPLGLSPVLFAALVFFFSYVGFTLILDVAGEVKNPRKNIPRALFISFILLITLYTLQALMVAGIQPWNAPVGTVIEIILTGSLLPQGMVVFMAILIAIAIASTIHPSYMAYSRDILMISREFLFPKRFSKVHEKQKTPIHALTLLLVVGMIFLITFIPLLTALDSSITIEIAAALLSAIVGVVVLIIQIPLCIGAIIFKKKFPEWHENAGFKPSPTSLKIIGSLGAIFSLLFLLLLFTDPDAGAIIAIIVFPFTGIGAIVYWIRKGTLQKRGINIKEIMRKLPESVSHDEGMPSKLEKLAKDKEKS